MGQQLNNLLTAGAGCPGHTKTMGTRYYTAEQVTPIVKAATDFADQVIEIAADQQRENEQLRQELSIAKAAAQKSVELEKVAAANQLDGDTAAKFVEMLADRAIIDDKDKAAYTDACIKSANTALAFAMKAIELTDAPRSLGRGIKSASVAASPEDEELRKERELWMSIDKA